MIQVARNFTLDERDIEERFVRAAGPAARRRRTEATAVELRLHIGRSSLPEDVKARLRALDPTDITKDDVLVVMARMQRSQLENRLDARERLARLLQQAAIAPKRRRVTKPDPAAREERLAVKKLHGRVKRQRRVARAEEGD